MVWCSCPLPSLVFLFCLLLTILNCFPQRFSSLSLENVPECHILATSHHNGHYKDGHHDPHCQTQSRTKTQTGLTVTAAHCCVSVQKQHFKSPPPTSLPPSASPPPSQVHMLQQHLNDFIYSMKSFRGGIKRT